MIKREATPIKIKLEAVCKDGIVLYDGQWNANMVIETVVSKIEGSKVNLDEASLSVQIFVPKDKAAQLLASAQAGACYLNFEDVPTLIEIAS